MKKRHWGQYVFLVFAVIVILSLIIPSALTPLVSRTPVGVVVKSPDEPGTAFFGPLETTGYDVSVFSGDGDEEARFAYIAAAPIPRNGDGDETARTFRDEAELERWKRISATGTLVIVEPGAWSADSGPVMSSGMEAFLGARRSGWTATYISDPDSASGDAGRPASLRKALERRRDSAASTNERRAPCLALESDSGEIRLLEAGIHFEGRAPILNLGGRKAPVYARISLNAATPDLLQKDTPDALGARNEGSVDFGLTDAGLNLFGELGIEESIPAAVTRKTGFSETIAFNIDFSAIGADYGTGTTFGLAWFRSRFAMFRPESNDAVFWRALVPTLLAAADSRRAGSRAARGNNTPDERPSNASPEFSFAADYRAAGKNFWKRDSSGKWQPFIVKGVNLGPALPGKSFTEFPVDENIYYRWFSMMHGMNLNTVRVYTLLPPAFYRALRAYNMRNEGSEILLLQEIWPEENPPEGNCLDSAYTESFFAEIDRVISCVHGDGDISPRRGRAWGVYADDVSPWVLAFLIGRELEPAEVASTDAINEGYSFRGKWFSSTSGTPTEAWLASACDRAASREIGRFASARPISVVSWPPLDPVPHWVEWRDPAVIASGKRPVNDSASVDISRINVEESFSPGFFGSYHIYPNYPDFMTTTPWYAKYQDSEGSFRYGGYLKEFMMNHARYPALLAEYGMSTSLGVAYFSPDGMHHGGQSESAQGHDIVRMTKAALAEGFAGTVVFEWIDEWAKKTWVTEPFMIPIDRHMNWHNALDPEQYYGLIAMEGTSTLSPRRVTLRESEGPVSAVTISGDETYLRLSLGTREPWTQSCGTVLIALDVADRNRGVRSFPGNLVRPSSGIPALPSGCEFLVQIDIGKDGAISSRILPADSYNPGRRSYTLDARPGDSFEPMSIPLNRASVDSLGAVTPRKWWNRSELPTGDFSDSRNCVAMEETGLDVRIPWGLLNVSDPSSLRVIDDPGTFEADPPPDTLKTVESQGILAYGAFIPGEGSEGIPSQAFPRDSNGYIGSWVYSPSTWNIPRWTSREKESVAILREFFGTY